MRNNLYQSCEETGNHSLFCDKALQHAGDACNKARDLPQVVDYRFSRVLQVVHYLVCEKLGVL